MGGGHSKILGVLAEVLRRKSRVFQERFPDRAHEVKTWPTQDYGEKKTDKEKSHKGIWRSGCPGGVPGTNSGRPRDTWDIWAWFMCKSVLKGQNVPGTYHGTDGTCPRDRRDAHQGVSLLNSLCLLVFVSFPISRAFSRTCSWGEDMANPRQQAKTESTATATEFCATALPFLGVTVPELIAVGMSCGNVMCKITFNLPRQIFNCPTHKFCHGMFLCSIFGSTGIISTSQSKTSTTWLGLFSRMQKNNC